MRPLGVRARRELAVPPHFRRRRWTGGCLDRLITGASRRGIGPAAGSGGRFSPHSGGSSRSGREAAFSASGGSLLLAIPVLLVSVSALAATLPAAGAARAN